ncbi:Acm Lyzozyme M1 (1,4-beta-N-acetylmuramidase) [uncultured Caudovirales phage]|uniref:lysozyme n=1 Tax=uncultured Caudovirales phage TaxID=2100421 RepID=A0A6J5N9Y7_9CAUD|nr:Acm Lyzozyme M1 (1,4-beta-N-acetylmuramidase) [uncultured Caudovirales phage]
MIKGIDISRWQGLINWPMVSKNVDFAFIKIGGSDDGFYPDGQAVRNAIEARANGVPVGFYVYLGGAFNISDEVAHIKNLISNIGGLRQNEVLALDWEERHPNEVEYVAGIAKSLVDAGIKAPLIYMSLSRVRGNNWQRLVDLNCGLWVAAWGNNDDVADATPPSDEWPMWAVWQYSSTGSIPGISGRVDLDLFQGTVDQFKQYGQGRTVTLPAPTVGSKVVFASGSVEYSVAPGESLSVIAAKFGKSWQELWALNRDRVSQPDKIFPGQKLRVWSELNPPLPTPAPIAPPENPNVRYYDVVNGDNLSNIAAKFALPNYIVLYEANKDLIGPNPDLIRPGQRLRIP